MSSNDLPKTLKYNKDSSWVKLDGKVATVGVIGPAAKAVEEFLFVKLPDKGKIKRGDAYVALEALKWSGELKSPLSGEVVEINEEVYDEPSMINKKPYEAWIMKIKIEDEGEIEKLFEADEIGDWIKKSFEE